MKNFLLITGSVLFLFPGTAGQDTKTVLITNPVALLQMLSASDFSNIVQPIRVSLIDTPNSISKESWLGLIESCEIMMVPMLEITMKNVAGTLKTSLKNLFLASFNPS
jgi:hypothetical protein